MIEQLKSIIPPDRVATDQESIQTYGKDWTKHYQVDALGVVFPKTTEEVQSIVQWAIENKVALVPSGGRTGLSGAAIATQGELVVSFEKMNKIIKFDGFENTVTCEARVHLRECGARLLCARRNPVVPVDGCECVQCRH